MLQWINGIKFWNGKLVKLLFFRLLYFMYLITQTHNHTLVSRNQKLRTLLKFKNKCLNYQVIMEEPKQKQKRGNFSVFTSINFALNWRMIHTNFLAFHISFARTHSNTHSSPQAHTSIKLIFCQLFCWILDLLKFSFSPSHLLANIHK